MKKETKDRVKNTVTTGASSAAGAAAGIAIGTALSPETAAAQQTHTPEEVSAPSHPEEASTTAAASTATTTASHSSTTHSSSTQEAAQTPQQPETKTEETTETGNPSDELEVLGYERVTNDDGSQMDLAVLNVDGHEVGYIDADLDGVADVVICDANQNGQFEQNEMANIHDQGIAMQPLADAAGFNPLYAENNIPDYVDDADVDGYMA